jgi:hypothetical protein
MGKKSRLTEAGRFCQLRIGVARLVERQGARRRLCSPLWHFPLSRKRFKVPRGFACGEVILSINIKGLA